MEIRVHENQPGLHSWGFEIYNATAAEVKKFLSIALNSPQAKELLPFWQSSSNGQTFAWEDDGKLLEYNYVEYWGVNDTDRGMLRYIEMLLRLQTEMGVVIKRSMTIEYNERYAAEQAAKK